MLFMKLKKSLEKAADEVKYQAFDSDGALNSARSKAWVKFVSDSLRSQYKAPEYRVFSRDYDKNREAFKLNELLYDIFVAKIGYIKSASGKKNLEYISNSEWVIESEFQEDSRASIIDFSKLLVAKADRKLMILPSNVKLKEWALCHLGDILPNDNALYYLCFIPHPRDWDKEPLDVELYLYQVNEWVQEKN